MPLPPLKNVKEKTSHPSNPLVNPKEKHQRTSDKLHTLSFPQTSTEPTKKSEN